MTNELAIADSFAPVPLTASILDDLRQQAESLDAAYRVAEWVCSTGFAPELYRGKPKEGAVAILFGSRLGLDAIQSLQNVFNVYGVPSTYAKVMKAAVLAAGHEVWTVEKSATRCVVRARRRGSDPTLPPEESVWDMERVRRAGYDKRNDKYNKEPENMLYARATAEACRAVAPDVLLGIDVEIEEVRDRGEPIRVQSERVSAAEILGAASADEPDPASNSSAKPDNPQARESAADKRPPAEEPKPPAKKAPAKRAAKPVAPKPGGITEEQLTQIRAMLDGLDVTAAEDKRDWIARVLEREPQDPRTLSEADGRELIDELTKMTAGDQGDAPADGGQLPIEGEGGADQ